MIHILLQTVDRYMLIMHISCDRSSSPEPQPRELCMKRFAMLALLALACPLGLAAQTPAATDSLAKAANVAAAANTVAINFVWTLVCGFLVMFMQAGFAMVETGFTRAKNAAHTIT